MTPSGNCTASGVAVRWMVRFAVTASDSRIRVLFAPVSAQTSGAEDADKAGTVERKTDFCILFCLMLVKVEVELILLMSVGDSEFLSWPDRQGFPLGGEELDTELRCAVVYLALSASMTVHFFPGWKQVPCTQQ